MQVENRIDTLNFYYKIKPDLINVDADKLLLAEKTDNKTEANFIAQYKNARNYMDRREAIDFFGKKAMPELAKGLNDKYSGLKILTIQKLAASPYKADAVVLEQIETLAKSENKKVKAAAISYLVKNGDKKYLSLYEAAVNDSSYSVAGAALKGLVALNEAGAYSLAKKASKDAKGALGTAVNDVLLVSGTEEDFTYISTMYKDAPPSQEKLGLTTKYATYLAKISNIASIKTGIDNIIAFRNLVPAEFRSSVDPSFKAAFDKISKSKGKEIEDYIKTVFN